MVNGKIPQYKLKKQLTVIICALILLAILNIPYSFGFARAQIEDSFISEPGKIPFLSDWETPVLEPGEKGILKFSITNRYYERNFATNNITNIELTLGIYEYATLTDSRRVDDRFEHTPTIERNLLLINSEDEILEGSREITTVEPDTGIQLFKFIWSSLPGNETYHIELLMTTDSETPEGTYFIKTELTFLHEAIENRSYTMRSKGYFTDELWEHAKSNAPDDFIAGINLTVLGVDGIIPETSFSVKIPVPFWPFFVLAGLTGFFGVLAIVFYYMEEHNKFPNLKARLDRISKKFK